MLKIVIYTEGGFYLGLGNIYRMIELAKSIKSINEKSSISFVTSSENYVVDIIRDNGLNAMQFSADYLTYSISQLDFNILIVDKLNIEEVFIQDIRNIKALPFKVVLFGNLSSANKISDLVVNAIIGTDYNNKRYIDENKTRYLTGPKYLLLRDEFVRFSYVYQGLCKNILLLFGGTDQMNYSCKVLKTLLQSKNEYNITLIIGKGYNFIEELDNIVLTAHSNVQVLHNINNVAKVMLENDFLITSPGSALFEGLYLGLPCLALFQNQSQKDVFRDFITTKSLDEIEDIVLYIQNLYADYEDYRLKINNLEIGTGKNEIINQIINLV